MIEDACNILNVHDFIMQLPLGYETIIRESSLLTDRQKQRIDIVRDTIGNLSSLLMQRIAIAPAILFGNQTSFT